MQTQEWVNRLGESARFTQAFPDMDMPKVALPSHTHPQKQIAEVPFQEALKQLTAVYPEREVMTFERQEQEARAYLAGDDSNISHIEAIANARGITIEELADKIVRKADAFAIASGSLIGQRQQYEDQLEALGENATAADINAITINYVIPTQQ